VLYAVFLVSGFAALLYQIVWQRALYAIYGINIESVTMVVTAFMLGLGLGSVTGGAISKNPKRPALLLFAVVELGIALFGFFSLAIFQAVGRVTLHMSSFGTGLVTFLLVLAPTMLMGATLPLLVGHMVRVSRNVGKSVGTLYFVNTLGSAFASFAAPLALLPHLGQSSTVRLAAVLNVTVSLGAYALYRLAKPARAHAPSASEAEPAEEARA
jgi:predicted membrane-bound spermidine synthase